MTRFLWPAVVSLALALFAGIVWLAEAEPAFRSVDAPVSALPMRTLDGGALPDLTRPTVVLVWLPG